MIKQIITCLFVALQLSVAAYAQQDTTDTGTAHIPASHLVPVARDPAAIARYQAHRDSIKAMRDSLKAIGDSLSMVWLKSPDPNRPNRFLDSLVDLYRVKNLDFAAWAEKFPKIIHHDNEGRQRQKGEVWIFWFIILLLIVFAVLKKAFGKEFSLIFQSLFSKRLFSQISREEQVFSSWPFIILYVLLAFIIGTFLYLCTRQLPVHNDFTGFQGLLSISLIVLGFFTFKIISLKLLGFIFNLQKPVKSYISALYIAYFNVSFLFLPLTVAICLTPLRFAGIYMSLAAILTAGIFLWQFLRSGIIILTEYRLPIVYLILYICVLEICPLIVLIKLLRF